MLRRALLIAAAIVANPNAFATWEELERSLTILREAASPHEIARTQVAMAALAPMLARQAMGQAALDEALPVLRDMGAQRDIDEACAIAARHGYTV